MEQAATELRLAAGPPPIVVGGLILAAVTSLPERRRGVYLASRGRGAAALSTAFNSNAINVLVGLLVPALLGLGGPSDEATFVALFYVGLTALAIGLAVRGKGLDRRTGAIIVAGYIVFAAVLIIR